MSKIKDIKLLKAEINIMRNMPKQCELKVKRKAQISAPKEEGDRTALLNLGLSVETIESEGIKIELEAAQENLKKAAKEDTELLSQAEERVKNLITDYVNRIGEATGETYEIKWK